MTSLERISSSTEENAAGTEEVSANSEEVMATMNWFNGNISELKKIPVISRFDQIFSTLCILQGVFV